MTSIRDWCPACNETGWACTCRKATERPATAMTIPVDLKQIDELVERLRQSLDMAVSCEVFCGTVSDIDSVDLRELLTAFKAQASLIDGLRSALEPFAAFAGNFDKGGPANLKRPSASDFRNARDVLAKLSLSEGGE